MKLKLIIIYAVLVSFCTANAQELSDVEMNKFPELALPYQTPQNLPSTNNKPEDLKQFKYVGAEVTNFLKGLKVELEKNSKCYAIGQLNYHNQLLLLYMEVFKSPYGNKHDYEFDIKMTSLRTDSDKSILYLANSRFETTKNQDDKQHYNYSTSLSAYVYIKDKKLHVDSKIRMIDDLILKGTNKTERTKDVVNEFRDVLIDNEFEEVATY